MAISPVVGLHKSFYANTCLHIFSFSVFTFIFNVNELLKPFSSLNDLHASVVQISKISNIVLCIMYSVVTQHAKTQPGDRIISLMLLPICVLSFSPWSHSLSLFIYVSFSFLSPTAWHKKRNSNAWKTSTRIPWNLHQGRAQAHGPRMKQKARLLRGRSGPVSLTLSCLWPEALSD